MITRSPRLVGLTLVETLCVIVIIATLTALAFPVLANALHSSRQSSTLSRFRQLSVAFQLYRETYDDPGVLFGRASDMGLPVSVPGFYGGAVFTVEKNPTMWKSPCGRHPQTDLPLTDFNYYPSDDPSDPWVAYVERNELSSVFLEDQNCTPHHVSLEATHYPRTLIGLRVDGGARVKLTTSSSIGVGVWEDHKH